MKRIISTEITARKAEGRLAARRFFTSSLLIALLLTVLLPLSALAGKGRPMAEKDRFVLDFGDSHYVSQHGESATIFLKKALKRQYPGVDVSDYRLRKVVLVAKTKHGRGNAQLRIGPEVTDLYRVGGHPKTFHRGNKQSFDRVQIYNPFNDSWGPWQLFLNGNFKVRKVVLIVERRTHQQYGSSRYEWPERHEYSWGPYDGRFSFKMRW